MSTDAYMETLSAGHKPDAGRRAAMDTVRRILLEAEEVYLAGPDLTLGAWLARVQETISVAAEVTLSAAEDGRELAEDEVVFDEIAVFAEVCAEAIRGAARVGPDPAGAKDPKEAILAQVGCGEMAPQSRLDWIAMQRTLMRCQAALEPVASGLRDGDFPMNHQADPAGIVYTSLVSVAQHSYGVVYGLCVGGAPEFGPGQAQIAPADDGQPATSTGRAGASVRRTARRIYVKAAVRIACAAAVVVAAIVVAANGASSSAILLALVGAIFATKGARSWSYGRRYALGADSEERVGSLLDKLGAPWAVEHDVSKAGGGNVDHVVHSPTAIYLVDTKRSRYREKDFDQARRHEAWGLGRYGGSRPIVSVICLERSDQAAELIHGVWVVGAARLLSFLQGSADSPF